MSDYSLENAHIPAVSGKAALLSMAEMERTDNISGNVNAIQRGKK